MRRLCDLLWFYLLEGADEKKRAQLERALEQAAREPMIVLAEPTGVASPDGTGRVGRRPPSWYRGDAAAANQGLAAMAAVTAFPG